LFTRSYGAIDMQSKGIAGEIMEKLLHWLRPVAASYELRRSPLKWLVFSGFVMISAIAIGTALTIDRFRDAALASGSQRLENAVLLLARHFDRQLADNLILQRHVVADLASLNPGLDGVYTGVLGTLAVHELLRASVGGWADVAGFNVFDAKGNLVNSSRVWPVPALNIADRDYFKSLAEHSSIGSEISSVTSRFSGEKAIVFAQRISATHGAFLGVVTRAVRPDNIGSFFASAGLGEGAAVAMHHRSGNLLARFPAVDELLGKNFKNGSQDQRAVFERYDFVTRLKSPVDGKDRILASRALSAEPLVIVATQTMESALATWRSQTGFFVGTAAVAIAIIGGVLYSIFAVITQQLCSEKKWLRTAVDHMNQGLLLFDAAERLVVCNSRYLDMYGLSEDVIRPGCSLRRLVQHRAETGSLVIEAEAYYQSIIGATGAKHCSVVRTTDGRLMEVGNEPVAGGGWLATHEDVTERLRAEERINHLAYHDQLTGLPNRTLFQEKVEAILASLPPGRCLILLFIDVDKFKDVNDLLGHHVGDALLKVIASRLQGCVQPHDIVARLGGDEFAIATTQMQEDGAQRFASTVQEAIRLQSNCLGHQINADSSIGIAVGPWHGTNLEQLLKNADLAMYSAKANGRRSSVFFSSELEEKVNTRHRVEIELRKGLRNDSFEIHYQPIVDAVTSVTTGFEALLRFNDESGNPISPATFIPVAEETGLIIELGDFVLRQSCLAAARWPEQICVAVNVSPVQLRSGTFALNVLSALNQAGLQPRRLELEITEAVLIKDDEKALAVLRELKTIGVCIALDDFGTGYSSLSYLRRFPFDRIKIDRSFVADLDTVERSSAIVKAIIGMANACDMKTTAEGVETAVQRKLLQGLGCDQMQGYLFSPALPPDSLEPFMRGTTLTDLLGMRTKLSMTKLSLGS
jgi:diguanylate cyclase (GGDEF)-like protein